LDVFSELVDAFLIGASVDVVDSIRLVGSNELLVEDSWHWYNTFEVLLEGIDESWLENMSSLAGVEQVHVGDIPSGDFEITWINHWHKVLNWLEDILELVGLGGNNGTTFTAGILANKKRQSWETKRGTEHPNFHGSFT
jgi:hypothetical protein